MLVLINVLDWSLSVHKALTIWRDVHLQLIIVVTTHKVWVSPSGELLMEVLKPHLDACGRIYGLNRAIFSLALILYYHLRVQNVGFLNFIGRF